jgi:SSS family transporter
MSLTDWIVLLGTLMTIVLYGSWKTRKNKDLQAYLKGDDSMKWATIGLSIMATQASAITFLSTPGKAFESGMEFLQFYMGLPIAMILLSIFVLPIYYRLKVYTAYEYLEGRFDLKTRMLTAAFFLIQRGLAAGITIYAPAIILSSMLGWDLNLTCVIVGILVIIYTVSGGTRAVSLTQKWQMGIILVGMVIAFVLMVDQMPSQVGFSEAFRLSGDLGKMNIIDLKLDVNSRYNIWSGLFGGIFLFLSYFGTDQSQVQRYLGGKSLGESRMGLMFNGILKVPMQFFILLVGVYLYVFYVFEKPPVYFNQQDIEIVQQADPGFHESYVDDFNEIWAERKELALRAAQSETRDDEGLEALKESNEAFQDLRSEYKKEVLNISGAASKDYDYIFLTWILNYLPKGLIGLLLAVILSAAMSSTAGELNALASTSTIDFYKRKFNSKGSDAHYVLISRGFTIFWGVMAILFALYASHFDNLIEAVNIIGSLFYGTVLGVFVAGFFIRYLDATAIFLGALLGELVVLAIYGLAPDAFGFLWFNFIGCAATILIALILQLIINWNKK